MIHRLLLPLLLAAPLLLALQAEILGRGAWPLLRADLPGQGEGFWSAARDEHLDGFAPADLREADAGLGQGGPCGDVRGVGLGLGVGGLDLGGQTLDGVGVAGGVSAVSQEVTDAAGEPAGADAEAYEAHEHEQRKASVDKFDCAAAAAASQVKEHGVVRISPDRW